MSHQYSVLALVPHHKPEDEKHDYNKDEDAAEYPVETLSSFLLVILSFFDLFMGRFSIVKRSVRILLNVFNVFPLVVDIRVDLLCN